MYMNWHVNSISLKAWTRLNLLRALKFRVRNHWKIIHLIHSNIAWIYWFCMGQLLIRIKGTVRSNHTRSSKNCLRFNQTLQHWKTLCWLGCESLESRRNKHNLVLFYKILLGLAPAYFSDLLPLLVQETASFNHRNSGNIQNYRPRPNLFLNSYFPSKYLNGMIFQMAQKMHLLWPHSNIYSTEI